MPSSREEQIVPKEYSGASVIELAQRAKSNSPPPPLARDIPPASGGFATTIEDASMADLVQMECLRGTTRSLRVRAENEKGLLYFEEGQLVHAVTAELTGEEAALKILSWESGTVERSDVYFHDAPRIETSWQGLLMRAAQRRDEHERCKAEPKLSLAPDVQETDQKSEGNVGILQAVRLNREGELLQSEGSVEDLPDATAYALRLIELVGDGLGLENFRGFECTAKHKVLLGYAEADTFIALMATPKTDLSTYRERSGT